METTGGIVLCGGRSRRMEQPKAWLPFGQEAMLQRVVRILSEVVAPIVVVAAPGQDLPPLPAHIDIIRDPEEGRGPLQGLIGGLSALKGRVQQAYLSSCDVPFLQPAFVQRVLDRLGDHLICVPHIGEYYHPLAAVYRSDVAPVAAELLAQNRPRPVFLFESVPTRVLGSADFVDVDPKFQSLRNLNTPEDYAAALSELPA